MDERGYVRVTGRLKDMIIRGGENISPKEVEEVLFSHPQVAEVIVLGVPDPGVGRGDRGRRPAARPVGAAVGGGAARPLPQPDRALQGAGVVGVRGDLSDTAAGKIQKFELLDQIRDGRLVGSARASGEARRQC